MKVVLALWILNIILSDQCSRTVHAHQHAGFGCYRGYVLHAIRWQSQERAQHLKGKRLQDRQCEMEDALIDMKVSLPADLSLYGGLIESTMLIFGASSISRDALEFQAAA